MVIVQRESTSHTAMVSNTLLEPTEIIHLSGISWQTYEIAALGLLTIEVV
jgi:hypothetical protein